MTFLALDGVDPVLVAAASRVYAAMAALGRPMHPTEGVRSTARQIALYTQGRSAPGPIVTNADGAVHRSNHQMKPDGWGHAVDSAFDGPDPYLVHDPDGSLWWATYGALVRSQGLTWGGDWVGILDRPHMESPSLPPSKGPTLNA